MKTLVFMAITRSHRLTMRNAFHQNNFFSFNWIFPKPVVKVEKDERSDEFENKPHQIINLLVTFP